MSVHKQEERAFTAFHRFWGLKEIHGWDTQIVDEYVVNLGGTYIRDFKLGDYVGMTLESMVDIGTGLNQVQQGIVFRLSEYLPLSQSVYQNAIAPDRNSSESSFIFGCYIAHTLSNILLEGSLLDNPSPYTVALCPWQLYIKGGLYFRKDTWNFMILGTNTSSQFEGGQGHFYVTLNLGKSF